MGADGQRRLREAGQWGRYLQSTLNVPITNPQSLGLRPLPPLPFLSSRPGYSRHPFSSLPGHDPLCHPLGPRLQETQSCCLGSPASKLLDPEDSGLYPFSSPPPNKKTKTKTKNKLAVIILSRCCPPVPICLKHAPSFPPTFPQPQPLDGLHPIESRWTEKDIRSDQLPRTSPPAP